MGRAEEQLLYCSFCCSLLKELTWLGGPLSPPQLFVVSQRVKCGGEGEAGQGRAPLVAVQRSLRMELTQRESHGEERGGTVLHEKVNNFNSAGIKTTNLNRIVKCYESFTSYSHSQPIRTFADGC